MVQSKCLNEETLAGYLEGVLDAPVQTATEQHLVGCDTCRSQLVYYMRILDEDVREEEESVLQAAMARWGQGGAPAVPERRQFGMRWAAVAASVAIAAILGLFFGFNRQDVPSPVEIVELLLSESRPFEARLSQQPYMPLMATRGVEDGGIPMDPLESEMLRQAANDHMLGVFYLMNKEFDLAIDHLERAAERLPNDPMVHNDLGVAYMENGGSTVEQEAVNFSRAKLEFAAALDLDRQFGPSVYNLALLYERQGLNAEAQVQHDLYLSLDPDSQWADEIRQRRTLN